MESKRIAAYKIVKENGGNRYRFYCELSGALACVTDPICATTSEDELRIAWETTGIKHFNLCHKCGKWVIDAAYNVEVFECVECAPYETEPKFCKKCGVKIETPARKCPVCRSSLVYEGKGDAE